ncbi:peptidase family M28-domain-containing protein [Dipodascopsis uninucleata]
MKYNSSILLKIILFTACFSLRVACAFQEAHTQITAEQLNVLYKKNPPFPSLDPAYMRLGQQGEVVTNALLSPMLIPRIPGTENSSIVRTHIMDQFAMLEGNWEVVTDSFFTEVPEYGGISGELNFTNMIFRLSPQKRKASRQSNGNDTFSYKTERNIKYLTLVAHYDSKVSPVGFIGAIDSAYPCALLMYLAKAITAPLTKRWDALLASNISLSDEVGLQIIFMDGEEALIDWSETDSLYGARHLAHLWESEMSVSQFSRLSELQNIDLFVLLDLLGASKPQVPCYYPLTSWACKELGDSEKLARDSTTIMKTPGKRTFVRSEHITPNIMIEDDHIPFLRKGVPIFHVIPVPFPKQWHTLNDDGDHLDKATVHDWAVIFMTWCSTYFGLGEFV